MTTLTQFIQDSESFLEKCLSVMKLKNHDYSDIKDPFSNFKETADIAGITTAQAALVQLGNKLSRLSQLVGKDKTPLNESVEDTMLDIINYVLLLKGILEEEKKDKTL